MKKKKKKFRPRPEVTAKKPKRKRLSKKRSRFILWAGFACTFIFLLTVITFFWVDRKVVKAIQQRSIPTNGIYSAAFNLEAFSKNIQNESLEKKNALFINELNRRKYVEVSDSPQKIKEFSKSNGIYKILTRDNPDPKNPIKVDLSKPSDTETFLPPEVISQNENESVRASRFVPLKEFPEHTKRSVMAIEDERFYSHFGLDLIGIARAIFTNISSGGLVQGGSTLTQQLAKNMVLSPERSLKRKLLEILAAISIEFRLSKDEILELYLNEVYLGQEGAVAIHGFPEAAETYFGKRVQDLSVSESALLAGIIKAPSYFSPRKHLDRAMEREEIVVTKMKELGYVTDKDLKKASLQPTKIKDIGLHKRTAPYFIQTLTTALTTNFSINADEIDQLSVETGLDLGMQECAERAVQRGMQKIESAFPKLRRNKKELEVGLVSLEPQSGLVKAWVGGRSFSKNQFDHVSQGTRQIGSTIKPFLYLTALDGNLNSYKVATPISVLEDVPITLDLGNHQSWEPENYDKDYRGDVTLRYALENSLNLPAVYVAQRVGINAIRDTLLRFKVAEQVEAVPALALGALDTSLLKLTASYAALANGGMYVVPRFFYRAKDSVGFSRATEELSQTQISDAAPAYVLTDILRGVIIRGTAKTIRTSGFVRDAAGKTGTSDSTRDAWFVGFTPTLATGVWVGYDDNRKLGLTGGQLAAPIWGEFMKCSEPFYKNSQFNQPSGVITVAIDPESRTKVTEECPELKSIKEVFVQGTEPIESCGGVTDAEESSETDYLQNSD